MATFKEIRGQLIRKYTTNPTDPLEGQMWYNNTTGTLKGVTVTGAWSSSSPVATAREWLFMAGTQTASLAAGGYITASTNVTEEYNGSGWSAGGNLVTGRYRGGSGGTQTAALAVVGFIAPPGATGVSSATEEYNGTAWTEVNNISQASRSGVFLGDVGTQSSSLLVTGENPGGVTQLVEEYDGTDWTTGGTYPTATYGGAVTGASGTAVITGGGQGPATTNTSNTYNGTSWTANPTINTARDYMSGFGTSTACLITGGVLPPGPNTFYANVEEYDGTSWSEIADLASVRSRMGSAGTTTAGIVFTGNTPALTAATEEFNRSSSVITAATWAAGPTLGTGRYGGVSGGTTTTAIFAGGGSPRDYNNTELYDGSSWTAVNNMNTGRGRISGTGTPTSAVGAGGYTPGALQSVAEQWDGTDWSNITSLPTARQYMGSIGASGTAALFIGGHSGGPNPSPGYRTDETLYWDGSSWAAGGTYPNPVWNPRGFGTVTAGISAGGTGGPTTSSNSYNGASWTAGPSLNLARNNAGASGATDSDGLIYGGGAELTAEKWDGTSFATSASFANTHDGGGSNQNGSSSTAMIFGGDSPGIALFEEFTPETTAANIVTVTTS